MLKKRKQVWFASLVWYYRVSSDETSFFLAKNLFGLGFGSFRGLTMHYLSLSMDRWMESRNY